MFRSLYGKLALALLGLLGVLGVFYIGLTLITARLFLYEVNQKLDRDVAAHLVSEGLLIEGGQVRQDAVEEAFHMIMVVNPSIEIYLVDPRGSILAYSAPPGKVKLDRIDMGPVQRFLEGPAQLPITGDDPRHPGVQKAFSAAPIVSNGDLQGYLYVVLGGELYDTAVQMVQGSFVLRLGLAALIVAMLFAFMAGLLLFRTLTRRVARLSHVMDAFQGSGFTERPDLLTRSEVGGHDEIDRLGGKFATMAERIVEQVGELRRSDSLRRELVTNVSHDLRTPLASLRGYLETLLLKRETVSEAEQRRYLEICLQHSERLGRLVAELFDLAKLESRETRLRPEPFSLGELVQDVSQKHRLEALERGIHLETDLGEEVPFVLADIGLVERVLENLLENALKFTPAGGEVRVSLHGGSESVEVKVADTGCGIPEDDLPHIFDRFYRSKSGRAARGSSGLGLAISKTILDLHGSKIRVHSTVGKGTTFAFHLPIHSGQSQVVDGAPCSEE